MSLPVPGVGLCGPVDFSDDPPAGGEQRVGEDPVECSSVVCPQPDGPGFAEVALNAPRLRRRHGPVAKPRRWLTPTSPAAPGAAREDIP